MWFRIQCISEDSHSAETAGVIRAAITLDRLGISYSLQFVAANNNYDIDVRKTQIFVKRTSTQQITYLRLILNSDVEIVLIDTHQQTPMSSGAHQRACQRAWYNVYCYVKCELARRGIPEKKNVV